MEEKLWPGFQQFRGMIGVLAHVRPPLSVRSPFRDNCNKETRTSVSCSEQRKLWAHFRNVQLREEKRKMGKSQLANGSCHGSSLQCKLALFTVCNAKMKARYATLYTQSTIAMVCCSLPKVISYLVMFCCHLLLLLPGHPI